MSLWIIKLGSVSLTDTCGLLTSSGKKNLSRIEYCGEAEVVGVGHWYGVPLAVFEVFCRRCGHKAVGVSSSHRQLAVGIEQCMSGTRDVEIWQPLSLKLDDWACFLLLCRHR